MSINKFLVVSITLFVIFGCGNNNEGDNSTRQEQSNLINRNIIVLLDLSDRILTQGQSETDQEIINHIVEQFISASRETIIKRGKDLSKLKDKLQIFIAEQSKLTYDKLVYENKLRIDFSDKQTDFKNAFNSFTENTKRTLEELYRVARFSENSSDYSGADIWRFIKENLSNVINDNDTSHNYLIIITDGYLSFEKNVGRVNFNKRYSSFNFFSQLRGQNWKDKFDREDYGLIDIDMHFDNLKLIVLQIEPRNEWNEFDLINRVWTKWFNEMGINNPVILKKDNIGLVKSKIDDFLK